MKAKHENKMMAVPANKAIGAIMKNKRISLKLNTALRGHDAGATVRVRVDKNNVPLDMYWRDRMKDSKIDNCVSVVGAGRKVQTGKKKN